MNTAVLVHQPVLASHSEQMNAILMALPALRRGDATVRLPLTGEGTFGTAKTINTMVDQLGKLAVPLER